MISENPQNSSCTETTQTPEPFLVFANVVLGMLVGVLISLPIVLGSVAALGKLLIIPAAVLGAGLGYRQRKNRLFLYLCLFAIAILGGLILKSFEPTAQ